MAPFEKHIVALAQIARGNADARRLSQQSRETRETALRTTLADLSKAESEVILCIEEVTKARQTNRFQRLIAPVDGTIQQLEVHTIGGGRSGETAYDRGSGEGRDRG